MAKILIVDDDASFRFILKDFLEMNGYDCVEAGNVAQARRQLWWNKFDLILSDLNMPKESGFDLLDHVITLYPRTPFVLITGSGDKATRAQALKLGACAYLSKPCRLNELLSVVMGMIQESTGLELSLMTWGMQN
jgi:DNA-binding NtrC family response regulator